MEIVKALGDFAFVASLIVITMAPRIASLFLAMRRKQ